MSLLLLFGSAAPTTYAEADETDTAGSFAASVSYGVAIETDDAGAFTNSVYGPAIETDEAGEFSGPAAPAVFEPAVFPDAFVEMSFVDPSTPAEWEDQTAYVRRFSTARGRDDELDRTSAGQARVLMDNRSGRYVPSNTQSPLYPDMRPMRGLRISARLDNPLAGFFVGDSDVGEDYYVGAGEILTYPIFTGYVEDWPQTWDVSDAMAEAEMQATDAFLPFGLIQFDLENVSIDSERSDLRVVRVLEQIGWPYTTDHIEAGTVAIVGEADGAQPVHAKALEYLFAIAETEGGNVFVDASGDLVFHAADHESPLDPTEVYGDADGETPYQDIAIDTGANRIWNEITVALEDDLPDQPHTASSPTSIARYFRRTLELTLLPSFPRDEISDVPTLRSNQYRDRYASPRLRITRLAIRPRTFSAWVRVLQKELGDVVLVRRRPRQGDAIEQVSRIEGISFDSPNHRDWVVTWRLSSDPVEPVSLLSENQRSLETDLTGWAAESNCTIERSTLVHLSGEAALLATSTALPASFVTDPVTSIAVTAGAAYRVIAGLHAVRILVGRSFGFSFTARLEIDWFDTSAFYIDTTQGTDRFYGSSWSFLELEATAPAGAVSAMLRVVYNTTTTDFQMAGDAFDFYEIE